MYLAAATAGHARYDAGACLRTGPVATFAEIKARQPNLRVHSGGCFLEAQLHVVPEVRAALRAIPAAAASTAAENILETKKVAEDILKLIEDRLVHAAVEAST